MIAKSVQLFLSFSGKNEQQFVLYTNKHSISIAFGFFAPVKKANKLNILELDIIYLSYFDIVSMNLYTKINHCYSKIF